MKYLITLLIMSQCIIFARTVSAQAIYSPTGNYLGYSQISASGVTNVYNATGQSLQSFQTDNGQTNFYSAQGAYQGTSTAPVIAIPNSTVNAPRQASQTPPVKGW